jgi:hypothetical protein
MIDTSFHGVFSKKKLSHNAHHTLNYEGVRRIDVINMCVMIL